MARRQAEYVLIDGLRVPIGFDAQDLLKRHLAFLDRVQDGLGYTKGRPAMAR